MNQLSDGSANITVTCLTIVVVIYSYILIQIYVNSILSGGYSNKESYLLGNKNQYNGVDCSTTFK